MKNYFPRIFNFERKKMFVAFSRGFLGNISCKGWDDLVPTNCLATSETERPIVCHHAGKIFVLVLTVFVIQKNVSV